MKRRRRSWYVPESDEEIELEDHVNRVVEIFFYDGWPRPGDHLSERDVHSIRSFLRMLPYEWVEDNMVIARQRLFSADWMTFRYFCGICWNQINGRPS